MASRLLLPCVAFMGLALTQAGAAENEAVEEVLVVGQGSQVELAEPFAGEQVARGSRAGLLGNLDMMDAPFSGTAYTQSLIQDQQARSVPSCGSRRASATSRSSTSSADFRSFPTT